MWKKWCNAYGELTLGHREKACSECMKCFYLTNGSLELLLDGNILSVEEWMWCGPLARSSVRAALAPAWHILLSRHTARWLYFPSTQDSPRKQGYWFSVIAVKAVPSFHSSFFDHWQPSLAADIRHLTRGGKGQSCEMMHKWPLKCSTKHLSSYKRFLFRKCHKDERKKIRKQVLLMSH